MKSFHFIRALAVAAVLAASTLNPITTMPAAAAEISAEDMKLLAEVKELLLTNRGIASKIASSLGIESSSTTPGTGELQEMNNALIIRNQSLFNQIAAKLGTPVMTMLPVTGTLIEQNHMLLRQNRVIVREIMSTLGMEIPPIPPSSKGSLVEQNRDLLLGNKKALTAIAGKLGVAI